MFFGFFFPEQHIRLLISTCHWCMYLLFPVKNAPPPIISSWPTHDALICPFQPAPDWKSNGLTSALFRSPHLSVLEFRDDFLLVPSCPGSKLLGEKKLLGRLARQSLGATLPHLISNSRRRWCISRLLKAIWIIRLCPIAVPSPPSRWLSSCSERWQKTTEHALKWQGCFGNSVSGVNALQWWAGKLNEVYFKRFENGELVSS